MAALWPLRLRSLHADFCAGERVMGVSQNISGLSRDGRALVIAIKVLTLRLPRLRARYEKREPFPHTIRSQHNKHPF
ncbi:hypothetical protein PMJEKBHI_00764 [Lacticaseibacillus rhamnosus]|nr:hypothetical protein PMJEKBHI_00764 [Lacticaseibacillus rhamnosus]VTU56596.1 hypothetical protein AMBR_DPAELIID_00880 [Lacticaseibacillus rhamnosus]VTZ92900.1 hypothetical protein LRHP344_01177 [Lacticaseibacillus rhamnosus]